jgi:hypothetical protein
MSYLFDAIEGQRTRQEITNALLCKLQQPKLDTLAKPPHVIPNPRFFSG